MPTASFSVSAPISAAARAGPRPRMTEVVRSPSQAARSSGSAGSASRRSSATAASLAAAVDLDDRRPPPARLAAPGRQPRARRGRPRTSWSTGPTSSPARVSSDDVGQSGRACCPIPLVTATTSGAASVRVEALDQANDLGALSRLAHRDEQPGAREQVRCGSAAARTRRCAGPARPRPRARSPPGSTRRTSSPSR